MNMPQGTGKKWPLALILYGLAIAVLIELLAPFLLPRGISLVISFAGFLIIYLIDIRIFNIILSGRHPNVINALKSHSDYFFIFFTILMALGFMFLLSNFLYVFLRMSGIRELLQLYPMLFAGAITSISIMFAVTHWVVNRVENIAELTETIQNVKALSTYAYILALFLVFAPLPIISSPSSSTSTLLLYLISFLLSYPFGLTASIVQALIMLDTLAVTLRYKLSEK